MFYLVKTPFWLKALYSSFIWKINTAEKILYLTFDDGPHETITPFVLDELKKYNAKASFFCIGKNVLAHSDIYKRVIDEGHTVGNHTHNHLNGWKVDSKIYIDNVLEASKYIHSNLFRPPYGRITRFQSKLLQQDLSSPFKIIMWDVLSGDFDSKLSKEKCLQNVILNARPGSIIVFHDSAKAWNKISYVIPKVLEYFSRNGFRFNSLQERPG